ncbi:MAG: hypothetical protein OEM15_03565 [Myxococcales bacterium]|nr:hypothetical protein [Myxococcales bacterium]
MSFGCGGSDSPPELVLTERHKQIVHDAALSDLFLFNWLVNCSDPPFGLCYGRCLGAEEERICMVSRMDLVDWIPGESEECLGAASFRQWNLDTVELCVSIKLDQTHRAEMRTTVRGLPASWQYWTPDEGTGSGVFEYDDVGYVLVTELVGDEVRVDMTGSASYRMVQGQQIFDLSTTLESAHASKLGNDIQEVRINRELSGLVDTPLRILVSVEHSGNISGSIEANHRALGTLNGDIQRLTDTLAVEWAD